MRSFAPSSRCRITSIAGAALAAFVWTPALARQDAPQRPIFRSSIQLVTLDVVATDRRGHVVRDLRQDEFQIVDRGRPQTIEAFDRFDAGTAQERRASLPRLSAPTDVATNGRAPKSGRAIVLLVDDNALTMDADRAARVRALLANVVRGVGPDDQMAITYERRSDASQDFTNDPVRLAHAAARFDASAALGPSNRRRSGAAATLASSLTFVLDALASAPQPQRAVVLVTSDGCDPASDPTCAEIAAKAVRLGVRLYGIDPASLREDPTPDRGDALRALTAATGGAAWVQSDLALAASEALDRVGSYYVLGFYPDPAPSDGKFHEVEVRVTRPDVRVQARRGYVASTDAPASAAGASAALDRALAAGMDNGALSLRAFAAPAVPVAHGFRTAVTVELTYPTQALADGRTVSDDVLLGMAAFDADGEVRGVQRRRLHLASRTDATTAEPRVILNDVIDIQPGARTLRIAVTSEALGRTGSVHLPIDLPDLNAARVQLTAPAIGSRRTPPSAYGADALRALLPMQPVLDRLFGAGNTLRVSAHAFWKPADPHDALVLVTLTIASAPDDGSEPAVLIREVRTIAGTPAPSGRAAAPIDFSVPLGKLKAGPHVLQLDAQVIDGPVASRAVPFVVR